MVEKVDCLAEGLRRRRTERLSTKILIDELSGRRTRRHRSRRELHRSDFEFGTDEQSQVATDLCQR